MTIQEMHDWFNFMVDKFDSPYYTPDEIDQVINRSQLDYVNELAISLDDKGIAEKSQDWELILEPIIPDPINIVAVNGLLPFSSIKSALSTGKLIKILAISNDQENEVKFVRSNDLAKFNRNHFKKATSDYEHYSLNAQGVNIKPSTDDTFSLVVIREPVEVDLTLPTNCELPSFTHNKVIARAVALAGIATEQQASTALNDITKI